MLEKGKKARETISEEAMFFEIVKRLHILMITSLTIIYQLNLNVVQIVKGSALSNIVTSISVST
jgi:hypothetical protein